MWPLSRQRTFGWPEALVLLVLVILGFSLLEPAIMNAKMAGKRVQCKNNLAQIGKALQFYQSQHGSYPPGTIYSLPILPHDGTATLAAEGFHHTGLALVLPHLEKDYVVMVNTTRPWYEQKTRINQAAIPVFICPSNRKLPEVDEPFMAVVGQLIGHDLGQRFGLTDYLFCKGVTDAWCLTPGNVKPWSDIAHSDFTAVAHAERGMFDIAFPPSDGLAGGSFICKPGMITDGASHTFMMGEGAQGPDFPITTPGRLTTNSEHEKLPHPYDATIHFPIYQAWMLPPNTSEGVERELYLGSVLGCTLEPLNQSPVTHTVIETDPRDLLNCRPSLDWDGPAGPAPGGGVHRTSNFRSAHKGGGHFLYADASVQFIDDDIDLKSYRAMSTIAGAEPVADE